MQEAETSIYAMGYTGDTITQTNFVRLLLLQHVEVIDLTDIE